MDCQLIVAVFFVAPIPRSLPNRNRLRPLSHAESQDNRGPFPNGPIPLDSNHGSGLLVGLSLRLITLFFSFDAIDFQRPRSREDIMEDLRTYERRCLIKTL